jgi:hypothetical protein
MSAHKTTKLVMKSCDELNQTTSTRTKNSMRNPVQQHVEMWIGNLLDDEMQ